MDIGSKDPKMNPWGWCPTGFVESENIQLDDEESAPAAFDLHPTPIAVAVEELLASLWNPPFASESMSGSALLLSYIRSQRWQKQLEDENPEWAKATKRIGRHLRRQDALELPPVQPKWLGKLDLHHGLFHNLLSRLPQDNGKV